MMAKMVEIHPISKCIIMYIYIYIFITYNKLVFMGSLKQQTCSNCGAPIVGICCEPYIDTG